jgi:LPXTG-motif cell wall-anchored protein
MLGLVFLFLGATYKIIQSGIDKGSAFLIIGVLVLILGWIFLMVLRKKMQ